MAHRHSQSCLLVQLKPALAACLAASGLDAWFHSGQDAQHSMKRYDGVPASTLAPAVLQLDLDILATCARSSGSASATYSTQMLHQVAQRQNAGTIRLSMESIQAQYGEKLASWAMRCAL